MNDNVNQYLKPPVGPNRMPFEVKKLLTDSDTKLPTIDDVQKFSLDDMIMYIINFLDVDRREEENYKYEETIALACAYELGNWFWTIFKGKASRCTRRVAPY